MCEFCKSKNNLDKLTEFLIKIDLEKTNTWFSGDAKQIEKKLRIKHAPVTCPVCGEPLTEPKPLTLEELKERVGKWIWFKRLNTPTGINGYAFVATPAFVGYFEQFHYMTDYGKTWLAYDREPRKVVENGLD